MAKVYLVEDDASIRELVVYTLAASGYEACGFESAAGFYNAMDTALPDILLLDIMLPGEDGLSILKKLRANNSTARLPVMMLTAKSTEYDKVLGLDAGADDYLAKPFGMMELLSRVRALLRRAQGGAPGQGVQAVCLGGIEVDPKKHTVKANGQPVALTLKEYDLLFLLLQNAGTVFTREHILQQVWGYEFEGESRTVDVHVRTLRQKLGSAGGQIQTVRGVGYRIGEQTGETP